MIRRRILLAGVTASLAAPAISRGASNAPLKFIPQSDLTIVDPIVTTVYTARNHGMMVFDTLFGIDNRYQIQPQMVDRVAVENDGRRWQLTLRDGLFWHDGDMLATVLRLSAAGRRAMASVGCLWHAPTNWPRSTIKRSSSG